MSVETLNWSFEPASSPNANSCGISYAAGDVIYDGVTADNFPAGSVAKAIHDFITAHGWTYWAPTTGAVAGKYYYKSLCLDGALYKYLMLDFVTVTGKICIRVAESWSASAVATNETFLTTGPNLHMSTTTLSGDNKIADYAGKIWLASSARYMIMQAYCNGVYGCNLASSGYHAADNGTVGIVEVTRQPYDTEALGLPKFGQWSSGGTDQQYTSGLWLPRTRNGVASNGKTRASYLYGAGGVGNDGASISSSYYVRGMPRHPSAVDSKIFASNILIFDYGTVTTSEIVGTMYGLIALTKFTGAGIGDDIQIPVSADSNFGNEKFYDPDGTLEPYWIIGSIGEVTYGHRFAIPK